MVETEHLARIRAAWTTGRQGEECEHEHLEPEFEGPTWTGSLGCMACGRTLSPALVDAGARHRRT